VCQYCSLLSSSDITSPTIVLPKLSSLMSVSHPPIEWEARPPSASTVHLSACVRELCAVPARHTLATPIAASTRPAVPSNVVGNSTRLGCGEALHRSRLWLVTIDSVTLPQWCALCLCCVSFWATLYASDVLRSAQPVVDFRHSSTARTW
jgi:hypothetical protein